MKKAEDYSKLITNLGNSYSIINLNNSTSIFKKNLKILKKKKSKNLLYFSFFFIIFLFIAILLLFKQYKLLTKINNNNNSLYYDEPSDDYNIINNNNSSTHNNIIINISLPKEIIVKHIGKSFNWYLTQEMFDKFNKFTNKSYNGILLDNKKYSLLKNPKISIIMPLYNAGNFLNYSLRSVQNQNMKEIEIILVDDCSTDDTIEIIEKYMKEDERIRLIKNVKNRQILYSKSIAALNSNGKYIIQLDQDDIFIREDLFDILYCEAEENNLDLVQFRDICKDNFYFKNLTRLNYVNRHKIFPKKTHFKIQPELKDKNFVQGNNYLLWGLLIKTDIYKKAVYHMWPIVINYKMDFQEDYTISFMIAILSQKYKYINHFGLIHLSQPKATSKHFYLNNKFYLGVLFLENNIFDYYIKDNPKDINIVMHYIYYFNQAIKIGTHIYPKLYKFITNKITSNDYLKEKYKNFLKNKLKSNIEEESKIWNTTKYLEYNDDYVIIYNFQYLNINKEIKNTENEPKISIIIICSEFKYLEKTIISIENQNFNNFEIIIVYDNNDQTYLDLINNFINTFYNIKLINNNNKKGYIYSVSLGVLLSKGQFILILESSYTLAKEITLNEIYNEIIYNDTDILEFDMLINNHQNISKNSLSIYKCPHYKSEINLTKIQFYEDCKGIDIQKDLLANKLIKANIFKDIIYKHKFNLIPRKIYNYYDDIFLFSLKNESYSFKHVNIFGTIQNIYNLNSLNISNIIKEKNQKIKDTIFYINFLYENSLDNFKEKEIVIKEFYNVMNIIYNKFNRITKESYNLYEKFINNKNIAQSNKELLKIYFTSLIN